MLWKYCAYLSLVLSVICFVVGLYLVVTTTSLLAVVLGVSAFGLTYLADGFFRMFHRQQALSTCLDLGLDDAETEENL